ncbi:MAG: hypothetical protein JNK49_17180 [Planctomycetes bacterium]|nr:hypothetical protein [Planctomycetota bacterium]
MIQLCARGAAFVRTDGFGGTVGLGGNGPGGTGPGGHAGGGQDSSASNRGVALLAVLFALTLLAVLALPFSVSMRVGAEQSVRSVERVQAEQASASVRDLLLAQAAMSHPALDPTPLSDGRGEYAEGVALPAAFDALREPVEGDGDSSQRPGRVLLGGAVWDLQRFLALDGISPLVLGNLLGSTTRLAQDLGPDATTVVLEDAARLPDQGFVWISHEVIRYEQKQGNVLSGLTRAVGLELGFQRPEQPVPEGLLVLDYRCVLAAAWPFFGRGDGQRSARRPFGAVGELAEIVSAGAGGFTAEELDVLTASVSTATRSQRSATWGRPERVFDALQPGDRVLRVKSALHVGAGSTVRLRSRVDGHVEYNLVMAAGNELAVRDLQLPSIFRLELLLPVTTPFPAMDTEVEPLVPAPVNVNTAAAPVLAALFAEVRRSPDVRVVDADNRQRQKAIRGISPAEAQSLAEDIVARRQGGDAAARGESGGSGDQAVGPVQGWQDFCERWLRPRLEAASNSDAKLAWLQLYRNAQTGRDASTEMGTGPICFESGPWVGYRAAASRSRSVVAPGVAARHERTGVALAVPGVGLELAWPTQVHLEEAFVLDRRAPFYATTPINLAALPVTQNGGGDLGNDPASRYFPHLAAIAFPGMNFGAPRFPSPDTTDAAITAANSVSVPRPWANGWILRHDSFGLSIDPRGHDVAQQGPYQITNVGPQASGGVGNPQAGRHDRISFPFSNQFGFVHGFAGSCWLEPQTLQNTVLFDHAGSNLPERNRLSVLGRDGNLMLELLDEAGLDPDPSQSPAGVPRTAAQWFLPLADLALPANTPLHVAWSAQGGRPTELGLEVDGLPRGRARFTSYLTAEIPAFDPMQTSQAWPPTSGNQRFLDISVERGDDFPPVGVVRVGTELFEYTSRVGNTLRCQWNDSFGGRAARQEAGEIHPDVPFAQYTTNYSAVQQNRPQNPVLPRHPVGSLVELYGYSAPLAEDTPMMVGATALNGSLGGFSVARGFVQSPRPIQITVQSLAGPIQIVVGQGLDATWSGDLELADPLPTRNYPPNAASTNIANGFPSAGGYALLMQSNTSDDATFGGVEVIRYSSRNGSRLVGVQRGQRLPGTDNLPTNVYDPNTPIRKFVTNWIVPINGGRGGQTMNDVPVAILWVVPISIAVGNTNYLKNPQNLGQTEWLQIYDGPGSAVDLEWVRYDTLLDNQHVVRAHRPAWFGTYFQLTTNQSFTVNAQNPALPSVNLPVTAAPWPAVTATSGYIGYVPQLEQDFPQVAAARRALQFRGDPFTRTSSHAHGTGTVTQVHRVQMPWGTFGAMSGRVGRHDRVALVAGSSATGTSRPNVEWHTVTWSCRRFDGDHPDLRPQGAPNPSEFLNLWPCQFVAFAAGVRNQYLGPPARTPILDPRQVDRVVKFPSGELPAAYCDNPTAGGPVGSAGGTNLAGFVDELDLVQHHATNLILDEAITEGGNTLRVSRGTYTPAGLIDLGNDFSAQFPELGGLLWVDGEVIAYQRRSNLVFSVANNGRGLLGTQPRGHDRGARIHFMTHRPAAILSSGVGARDHVLSVQSLAALPRSGTVRLGQELLHYTWTRQVGNAGTLEMPRWHPPGTEAANPQARGLFRGRYGTANQAASTGEAVVAWPFRYWDRFALQSDDPELAYFQVTSTEAPAYFRSVQWREQKQDARLQIVCQVRADGLADWAAVPQQTPGLWQFEAKDGDQRPMPLGVQASRLEVRFGMIYRPGSVDLVLGTNHAWKTTARIDRVRVAYEGQGRILDEQVSAR